MNAKAALYSAVGDELTHYELDTGEATLTRCKTVKAPANVQYAWPHPSREYLYVSTSNRGSASPPSRRSTAPTSRRRTAAIKEEERKQIGN